VPSPVGGKIAPLAAAAVRGALPIDRATIARWDARAERYDRLVRSEPIFAELADRLIERLAVRPPGPVADLAAGTGFFADRLLAAVPGLVLHLCEPAPSMLAIAVRRLGARIHAYHAFAAEEVDRLARPVAAMSMNAALHLVDEGAFFAAAARRLVPGGVVAANLWGHSFGETADAPVLDWKGPVERALVAEGFAVPVWPPEPQYRRRTRADYAAAADAAGLEVVVLEAYGRTLGASSAVAFRSIDPDFLAHLLPGARERVLARARALAEETRTVYAVELVARKR